MQRFTIRLIFLACLSFFLPLIVLAGQEDSSSLYVPILMYHYVSDLPEDADNTRIGLTVSPDMFRQHIEHLREAGYTTISLYDLDDALHNGASLPEKPVILTFDDGYVEHYNFVFPLLREHGMTATFFIVSDFADSYLDSHLNWGQISEMAASGMSIEAHTKDHADLRNRDEDFLYYEIMGSVESIEFHTGIRPHFLAYPFGRYDETTLAFLEKTDLLDAFSTESGSWHSGDNRYEMTRMRVSHNTTVEGLDTLLNYGS